MNTSPISEPFQMVAYGPEQWSTFCVFNGHAFPERLGSIVHSCSIRLALVLVARKDLLRGIADQRTLLLQEMSSSNRELYEMAAASSNVDTYAVSDGLDYLGPLYTFLMLVKSFLDVYAQLMGKLVADKVWTFGSAKINGQELSGGRIINWLQNSAPKHFEQRKVLAAVLTEHSKSWITATVDLRDKVTHYSDIPRFRQMALKLNRTQPFYDSNGVIPPILPNGTPLPNFTELVVDGIRSLVGQTVVHLPNVVLSEMDIEKLARIPKD